MKKAIIISILILTLLSGCLNQPTEEQFYGTWFPNTTPLSTGYHFDSDGNLYKAFRIGGEIYYTYYCTWHLDDHVLVLCGQRLNFEFSENQLHLYNFHGENTKTTFIKINT